MHFASPVQSPKPTFCQLSTSLWLFWLSPFNYVVKLEQLHQLVHKFFHFTHLFLQNSHISLSFLHVYSNKIFISLPTQPPTQTGITLESIQPISRKLEKQTQQQDRCTRNQHNPTTQSSNSELKQTQQHNPHNPPEIDASPWATRSMPPVAIARTRNKIDASKGKRWLGWWRETFNPIQPETHWSSPFNSKTTRNKGRKSNWRLRWRSAAAMAIDGS